MQKNIKPNGKYIYFCPPASEEGVNDIETIKNEARNWFTSMGLSDDDIVFYETTSDMGKKGKDNREAFYNDIDLNGESVGNKLRVMFAINQYNEGIHAPNIDGVIMGRGTTSDIVYFEQLGRALSVRGSSKEKYEEYETYSMEQLLEECKKRDISVKENTSKEDMIEYLIAPLVIDLANNFDFIKELENNLKDRIKLIQNSGLGIKREIKIKDASFDIEIENQDLYEMLRYVSDRLNNTWERKYEYAKIYYERHGNLEVPHWFKTNNGYEHDDNGTVKLGSWISVQRKNKALSSERIELLFQIGMDFENQFDVQWKKMYEFAKIYYEKHSNLNIPRIFKTNNGYEYDANGKIELGWWLSKQRSTETPESERGKQLCQIGMRFEDKNELQWKKMYEYAKIYYKKHGNLEVPQRFKTNNGYERDDNGKIHLGRWIATQRRNKTLSSERVELLSQIGMSFDIINYELQWNEMYKYAKKYYEKHENLEVPSNFRTSNGYERDDNGTINLGKWIGTQRRNQKISLERVELLKQIGMRFEMKSIIPWEEMYEYAKIYYEKLGNLEVPQRFKTNNGYVKDDNGIIGLGVWIASMRKKRKTLSQERIELLNQIGMIWNVKKNKSEIEEVCIKNKIDLNINKMVIEHISIQELQSKISFLQENGMPIIASDGKLHEIFFMSGIDMKEKYGVDLAQLIDKYYDLEKNKER